jgi:hypothetical protein
MRSRSDTPRVCAESGGRRNGARDRRLAEQSPTGTQAAAILACDLLCVDAVLLRSVYVLFFIEIETRRVHLAGITRNPTGPWIAQQARNLAIDGVLDRFRVLIRDRESKFTAVFDEICTTAVVRVIRTPIRTPVANAYAERFVQTDRRECLDWLLVASERHLRRVLLEHLELYHHERPHRGLALQPPNPAGQPTTGPVRRRDRLDGLVHEYHGAAARAHNRILKPFTSRRTGGRLLFGSESVASTRDCCSSLGSLQTQLDTTRFARAAKRGTGRSLRRRQCLADRAERTVLGDSEAVLRAVGCDVDVRGGSRGLSARWYLVQRDCAFAGREVSEGPGLSGC